MENLWTKISLILAGFLLVTDVALRLATLKKKAAAPELARQSRLEALESWRLTVESRLTRGQDHFGKIDGYIEVTALALLALLDHGTRGNNISQMEEAKKQLTEYILHQ